MAAISLGDPRLNLQVKASGRSHNQHHAHGAVVDEIDGLLRVYKDGHVERVPVVPEVPCTWSPEADVVSRDVVIDHSTRVWARLYSPGGSAGSNPYGAAKLPVLVYFHGGGFCVASAAWSCYHGFLAKLASCAGCLIMSVNYRLAPEHRLPTAFDDGVAAVKWLRQQASHGHRDEAIRWWCGRCDLSRVFLGGDSAGATIAHHVAIQVSSQGIPAVKPRGVILIQPFFGGEARTVSENMPQPPGSVLTLAASDAYWRLSLPAGAGRDHPWCNPLETGRGSSLERLSLPAYFVCISELDILRDREMEFCRAMRKAGKSVNVTVHAGVGHAFQILGTTRTSQSRTREMIAQIRGFLSR